MYIYIYNKMLEFAFESIRGVTLGNLNVLSWGKVPTSKGGTHYRRLNRVID